MYNENNLYSVRSLVAVNILNFQRDLVAMRFIRIELITRSTSKVDRAKYIHMLYVMFKQSALSLNYICMAVHFM